MNKEKENFLKLLIQSNFINMLQVKAGRDISEFKNNPNSIRNLIVAMGAGKEILESPAHMQMLEELLVKIVSDLEEAIEDTKADCGYSVKFDEQDRLAVKIESFATQDNYKLSISEDSYNFESSYTRSRIGTGKRIVHGNTKQILDFEDKESFDTKMNTGRKLLLDDLGFVIDELDASQTTIYKSIPGSYDREAKVSRKGSHISREAANVKTRKSSIILWNGDALHLNDIEEDKSETYKRAIINTIKCPNVQKYYEDILGISIDEMLKDTKVQE